MKDTTNSTGEPAADVKKANETVTPTSANDTKEETKDDKAPAAPINETKPAESTAKANVTKQEVTNKTVAEDEVAINPASTANGIEPVMKKEEPKKDEKIDNSTAKNETKEDEETTEDDFDISK